VVINPGGEVLCFSCDAHLAPILGRLGVPAHAILHTEWLAGGTSAAS
jgi:hypothetical protein